MELIRARPRARPRVRLGIMKNKKGFMFTLDAFLASVILVGSIILISQHLLQESPRESMKYLTTDALSALGELKMSEVDSTFVNTNLTPYTNNTNLNFSILEQIGTYWAVNETSLARNLSYKILEFLFPKNLGVNLLIGDDPNAPPLFIQPYQHLNNSVVAERMITGVEEAKPISGSTSSAYLRRINDKRTSSFAYFGGFVGQGNITMKLGGVPWDVTPERITRILVELDAIAPFGLYINGIYCDTLIPTNITMLPKRWDVTYCNSSIQPGTNNITLDFQGDINNAYVMGGYIRLDYKTDELQQTIAMTNLTYKFPEIRGVVNLYDSFYVPGNLTSMDIYLHYLADHTALNNTFYLTIGNTTVLMDIDSTTEQSITLNNALLQLMLNYSNLGRKTVPLRMGFENLTYEAQYIGNSQVMLVTDTSGTMDEEMGGTDNGVRRNCDDASFNNSDTQRLSVAKCLDKQFAQDVLNISGNTIGLVSYSDTTHASETVSPTTNLTRIDQTIGTANPQTGYVAGGFTCICCGINSARDQMIVSTLRTFLITNKSSWKYETNSFIGPPANDSEGDSWYEWDYNDSVWSSGNAVLGHNAGTGGVPVNTELGSAVSGSGVTYADLWENAGDVAGPPNDFTSDILNSTANTFGVGGANDGWDWAGGASAYGYDSAVNFTKIMSGRLNIDIRTGNPRQNRCTNYDCSGAYGITVNITPEMITMLSENGSAVLSFDYSWVSNPYFRSGDEAWIKGKWIEPDSTEHWLGSNLDASHSGRDSDPDIYAGDNPNQNFNGTTAIDLSQWITSAGLYYLHFGGKLKGDASFGGVNYSRKWGNFYFDNVQIRVSNHTDHYYFRKHFNLSDTNLARRGVLNLLSDDKATVYLNGNLIFEGQATLNGTYWDRRGMFVDGRYFKSGDNVVAVDLSNDVASAKFDLELLGINKTEQGAILVMTDGLANRECNEQGVTGDLDGDGSSDTASDDAIQAACDARQKWGIQLFAVGYSTSADEPTLRGIASCGEGIYAKSDNTSALSDFYNQVVLNIIAASIKSQTIIVSGGNVSASNLYGDSYVYYTYTPIIEPPIPNEISIEMQSAQFNNCSATVDLPSGIRIVDAKVTSYSGEHWTRTLIINSNVVYNLTEYNSNYITLGDPYPIQAPPNLFVNGTNTFYIDTGDDSLNSTGCSPNNTLIYTALVPSSTARSGVKQYTNGCLWTIQFEDNTTSTKPIPSSYTGPNICNYTASNHSLDYPLDQDAYNVAVYNLLKTLDFDNNGKVFVNLDATDIEIIITTIYSVPYLWGPTLVKVQLWQ